METSNLYQQSITKKQFFNDVEMAKKVVDSGFKNYFILINNTSFKDVRTIGGTTLLDIKDCYEGYPIYKDYLFAVPCIDMDTEKQTAQAIRIRDLTKRDRSELRKTYKFFPPSTYVAELIDYDGFTLLVPFKQNADGSIVPLITSNIYRKSKTSGNVLQRETEVINETIWRNAERIIELLPDLMDSLLAVVKYKDVDMCIPIEKASAKNTFRTRDKDGERRAHLIHNVNAHNRANLKKADKVKSHIRGASCFSIDGTNVSLIATPEWSFRFHTNHNNFRRIGINE